MSHPAWLPYVLTVFLAVCIGLFLHRLYRIIRLLRVGKAKEKRWDHFGRRLVALITLGIFQKKVYHKEVAVGLLHGFIFWAFVFLGASIVEITAQGYAPGWQLPVPEFIRGPLYFAEEGIASLGFLGVLMAFYRRYVVRPKKLMHEGFRAATVVLIFIMGIVLTVLFYNVAEHALGIAADPQWKPISGALASISIINVDPELLWWISWTAHVLCLYTFLAYVLYTKHSHILFAPFNSFWVNLKPKGEIKPIDLEKTEVFGVHRVEQLSMRQLLDGFACTECGRCTDNCPANRTGKPLDPMHLIIHMRDTLVDQGPAILAGKTEGLPDMFQTVHSEEQIWECTTCYACVYECPVLNEHVPKIIEMRRHLVLMDGKMPTQVMDVLRNVEQNYNPWGIGWDQRGKWAEGLDIKTLADDANVQYLFWVGCVGSFDEHGKKIAQSTARLMKKAGVSFGILGPEEKCTGDPARRMGNEYLAQTMIKQNIETLNKYAVKKIITMCPHCFNSLKHEFPDFGGKYEVVHHSQFLARLVREGRLKPSREVSEVVTYHDACYLGRYNDVFQEPRDILASIPGLSVVEMERSKETSLCCGGGGGRLWMEETVGKKVSVERTEQVLAAKAETVATACPYCTIMFDDAAKVMDIEGKLKRKDIAEILEQSVGG
jgi:Fe-S oxidoreductase